jgi:hypothetical protein
MKQEKPLDEEFKRQAEDKFNQYLSEFDEGPLMNEGLMYLWEQGKKKPVTDDTEEELDK